MKKSYFKIDTIPAILWGEPSDKVYLFVHGKGGSKEDAQGFAEIATAKGYQVLSIDLPEHGDRKGEADRCDVWNGVRDLKTVAHHAQQNWPQLYLFGCSLGAYFSLHACRDLPIVKCLFQSPLLDMEQVVHNMFQWFGVTEELLEEKKEIPTPIDTLSWAYYCFVRANPIVKWDIPTDILYGSKDPLQNRAVMDAFAQRFHANLTVSQGSDHPFNGEGDAQVVLRWRQEHID